MKKTNRATKQASPVDASSSPAFDDKERVRQLEQENKAFQVVVTIQLVNEVDQAVKEFSLDTLSVADQRFKFDSIIDSNVN
ncbi:hypothetical protein FCV25MIE_32981 [Fagus crenata]